MDKYFLIVVTRVKNESMMLKSFIPYYLSQGVDRIFLLDDSSTESYSPEILNNEKVEIKQILPNHRHPEWSSVMRCLSPKLRHNTEWVITVDCDEFITTRKNSEKTIRQELIDNFSEVSCIKIPWVMFSRNGRIENPDNVLIDTIWRWNHNLKHTHKYSTKKFQCRKSEIEIKCIWKASHYSNMWVHFPYKPTIDNTICVDGIDKLPALLTLGKGTTYINLTEEKITRAYFTCNHYRIVSEEHAKQKCNSDSCTLYTEKHEENILRNALVCDYPEVKDTLLKDKFVKL